jgi:NAD(P)-dependent dehydrogenase (short-subunit alcohol dehydrogenase family)
METLEAKKRVALVTGGMGGLGEAICLKLAGACLHRGHHLLYD